MHATADLRLPFDVRPLTPNLGCEILGVKIADGISDELFEGIYRAFLRYQVLLFPPQDVPPGDQVSFARHFGEVQVHVMAQYHADGYPELYRLSNLDESGKPNGHHPDKGTLAWPVTRDHEPSVCQASVPLSGCLPLGLPFSSRLERR